MIKTELEFFEFLAYCIHFDVFIDDMHKPEYLKSFVEFMANESEHYGDCTNQNSPCIACTIQEIKATAQILYELKTKTNKPPVHDQPETTL